MTDWWHEAWPAAEGTWLRGRELVAFAPEHDERRLVTAPFSYSSRSPVDHRLRLQDDRLLVLQDGRLQQYRYADGRIEPLGPLALPDTPPPIALLDWRGDLLLTRHQATHEAPWPADPRLRLLAHDARGRLLASDALPATDGEGKVLLGTDVAWWLRDTSVHVSDLRDPRQPGAWSAPSAPRAAA